jgi:hypothetical protein
MAAAPDRLALGDFNGASLAEFSGDLGADLAWNFHWSAAVVVGEIGDTPAINRACISHTTAQLGQFDQPERGGKFSDRELDCLGRFQDECCAAPARWR